MHENEMEFKKKMVEYQKKIQEKDLEFMKNCHELESLRSDFARMNWKYLQQNETGLTLRNILRFLNENYVYAMGNWRKQYMEFVKRNSKLIKLTEWNFTASSFVDAVLNFNERIYYKHSHPVICETHCNALVIPAEALLESEWRVLGVVWNLLPLPPETLIKMNSDGTYTKIDELLQSLDK